MIPAYNLGMNRLALAVVGIGLLASALAHPMRDEMAVADSLRHLPPNMRFYYLQGEWQNRPQAPASEGTFGLRLLGKWGAGPSVKVTGRDSLVFLSRGSEVVVVNFADTANPRVLSYIQVNGLVSRSVLVGNRLYVGTTGSDPKYIEVFDVSSPASPVKLGEAQTRLSDLDVVDTLAYVIARDSFRVFNFADPANPREVGACRDSGYDVSVCNRYAYVGDRWGLYVIDATNPASPHRVAAWGNDVVSVKARNTICCVTTDNPNNPGELRFTILDVRTPSSPAPLNVLNGHGGYDIYLDDSLAFVSGYYTGGHEFQVISIRDSAQLRLIAQAGTPGENNGVWADVGESRAYVADRAEGLAVFDIANLGSPAKDTTLLDAGWAYDVAVRDGLAVVADDWSGVEVLDVHDPTRPTEIAAVDTSLSMPATHSVWLADSFVYAGWDRLDYFRSIWIGDSMHPQMAGGCPSLQTWPEDMVVVDSLAYLACRLRFYVVNVARPRSPVLVGSCVTQGTSRGVVVQDTVAYVTQGSGGLYCINVANPALPAVLGAWSGRSSGVSVVDTVAFVTGPYTGCVSLSIANPVSPRVLDSLHLTDTLWWNDIAVVDSLAFVAGERIWAVDVSDPQNLRLVPEVAWMPPYEVRRLVYAAPYFYAACYDAGVCILETVMTGLEERHGEVPTPIQLTIRPNLTGAAALLEVRGLRRAVTAYLCDATGRRLGEHLLTTAGGMASWELKLAGFPVGVYFVNVQEGSGRLTAKVVKARR